MKKGERGSTKREKEKSSEQKKTSVGKLCAARRRGRDLPGRNASLRRRGDRFRLVGPPRAQCKVSERGGKLRAPAVSPWPLQVGRTVFPSVKTSRHKRGSAAPRRLARRATPLALQTPNQRVLDDHGDVVIPFPHQRGGRLKLPPRQAQPDSLPVRPGTQAS